jgi:hypothetical protein
VSSLEGINDALGALRAALSIIQSRAVKAVQKNAQPARKEIALAWQTEHYYGPVGQRLPVRPYGARWSRIKRRMGYSLRRGTATGGVQRVLNKPGAVALTPRGFVIDFALAAVGVVTKYRNRIVGSRRRKVKRPAVRVVPVPSYMLHMSRQKAPGLGNISKTREGHIRRDVQTVIDKQLRNVSRSISKASGLKGGYVLKAEFDLFVGGRAV